jgi:hypothetical protein
MAQLQPLQTVRNPIWPVLIVACGLSLTATWMGLLGYGLVKLIGLAL